MSAPTPWMLREVLPAILDTEDPVTQARIVVTALEDEDLSEADLQVLLVIAGSLLSDLLDFIEESDQAPLPPVETATVPGFGAQPDLGPFGRSS